MVSSGAKTGPLRTPPQRPGRHTHRPRLRRIANATVLLLTVALGLFSPGAEAEQSRLERILQSRLLRVCIWPEYYGITFRDRDTQELKGIDIDLALELGRELQAGVKFVDSNFSRLTDDLLDDRCDVAMFGIGMTAARAQKVRFTAPYLASDIYAITTRGNRRIQHWDDIDQPGITVAIAKGTLHESVMSGKLRHARLRIFASAREREEAVESGLADVFMTDYPYGLRMIEHAPWARLVRPESAYHVTPYAWAISPGDEQWRLYLDTFLATLKRDGRLARAARRHGLEQIAVAR